MSIPTGWPSTPAPCTGRATRPRCWRASLSGGPPATLVDAGVGAVAVDSTSVYFSDDRIDGGAIARVPHAGGTVVALAPGIGVQITADGTNVYWAGRLQLGTPWIIASVPVAGGAVTTLATMQDGLAGVLGIAVDDANVYWTTGPTVMKVPIEGGVPTTLVAEQQAAYGIAVDSTSVYWGTATGVMKLTPK